MLPENMKKVRPGRPINKYTGEPVAVLRRDDSYTVAKPSKFEIYDVGINYYHNIGEEYNLYVKYSNGIVIPIEYVEMEDTGNRGIFMTTRFAGITKRCRPASENETVDAFVKALLKDEFLKHFPEFNDVIVDEFVTGKEKDLTRIENLSFVKNTRNMDAIKELQKLLKMWQYYTQYHFLDHTEFGDADVLYYKNQNVIFYSGEGKDIPFPHEKDYDTIESGVAITIRNSKNPHKTYYANVLGNVVSIPVKRDGHEDGVTIVKTFKGQEKVLRYDLDELESIGIYQNFEDAEANIDKESRVKIAELEMKQSVSENSFKSSEIKLELERMNIEHTMLKQTYEHDRLEWEAKKMQLEKEKKEIEKELDELKHKKEMELLIMEKENAELKSKQELMKQDHQREKMENEKTISLYKTVATVITATLTVLGAIWKFF